MSNNNLINEIESKSAHYEQRYGDDDRLFSGKTVEVKDNKPKGGRMR